MTITSLSQLQTKLEGFKTFVWELELNQLSRVQRFFVLASRIATQVAKDIWEGQLTLRAMSLVYTTLLSLVPLLAISFSVLKGFGVHRELEPFLITFLAPLGDKAEEIALRFVEFIDNTSVSALGYIGFTMLFYAVISLMQKIERAFNFVWRVEEDRTFGERVRDYLTLIIIGPTLMFAATGLWATVMGTNLVETLASVAPLGWLLNTVSRALPILLVIIAFTFIYAFVPNTKVRWRPALIAAFVSGVLWNAGGVGFAVFVGNSANYPTIYSGFASAVFFMIWLYLAWMILLVGSSISFYLQHPYFAGKTIKQLSIRTREKLAFAIVAAVGARYYQGAEPHTITSLAAELKVPKPVLETVIPALEAGRLLARVSAKEPTFVPAQSWAVISLSKLIECVRQQEDPNSTLNFTVKGTQFEQVWDNFDRNLTASIDQLTLKDLAANPTDNVEYYRA